MVTKNPTGKQYTQDDFDLMSVFHGQLLEAEAIRYNRTMERLRPDNTPQQTKRFIENEMRHVITRIPTKSIPHIHEVCPYTYHEVRWGPFLIFRRIYKDGDFEDEMTYVRRVPSLTKRNLDDIKKYPHMAAYVTYAEVHTQARGDSEYKTVHLSDTQEDAAG